MKKNIHPPYQIATIKCACGETYQIPSVKKAILVEMCKKCSPLFTGKEEKRVIMGQIEKFMKRQQKRASK
jgi:large subunit ribosomal protein L31